ncbi:family 16 glycoside hydrolase [Rubrobacter xylanophilus]|uniref:family 16 glycoside hydrolase n=1 Tax=Rubrobacter xylanophilus TaxID=49319 RepID=UPI001C63F4C4|nr:family 16 glycoside hydrolase [Rubrobacter xylanophilus]
MGGAGQRGSLVGGAGLLLALLLVLLACPPAEAEGGAFRDDFSSYAAGEWPEGSLQEGWRVVYNGYGEVGVTRWGRHYQWPAVATAAAETHASLVVSRRKFSGVDLTLRQKTVRHLRRGSEPNPWEVAWVLWGYRSDTRFYYFILKPNGIELGKAHPGYPGAQRFLYTASSPRLSLGEWNRIRVRQVGRTIDVWVDGVLVVDRFVDTPGPAGDGPYLEGSVGMYTEDAHTLFDDVRARPAPSG